MISASLKFFLLAAAFASLCSCASVNFDYPKTESTAFQDTDQTYLGRQLEGIAEVHPPGYSGFYPIGDGIDALTARILLANWAERAASMRSTIL